MASRRIQPCERLYLNRDGADVWFVSGGERIPSHKAILLKSPWFRTMFCGSLPEQGDVDITDNATAAEFKEFLQFFYLFDVKLTLANIEGVFNLGKQSMVEEFFLKCELFLIDKLTIDRMCWGYELAIMYDARELELFCERGISMNTMEILQGDSFLNANYETVERILKLETLLCTEKHLFDACIQWARTMCENNQQNPDQIDNLKEHLRNLLYEIRYVSMKDEEFGTLLHTFPELFSKEEIQELVFIRCQVKNFTPNRFKANPRQFQHTLDRSNKLTCDRFINIETGIVDDALKVKRIETTTFSSNRPVLLLGFLYGSRFGNVKITITEKFNDEFILPLFERPQRIAYDVQRVDFDESMHRHEAEAVFQQPFVIEPNIKYEIKLELETVSGSKRSYLKSEVHLNQGVTIQFHPSDKDADTSHSVITKMFFIPLINWPTKRFFQSRLDKTQRAKRFFERAGGLILKCCEAVAFVTSLIM